MTKKLIESTVTFVVYHVVNDVQDADKIRIGALEAVTREISGGAAWLPDGLSWRRIVRESEIADGWKYARPYGSDDNRRCIEWCKGVGK